ncbi:MULTISPECIES: endopeptidase La [Sanguibacteroides]|uniref:Lon protease n=1 Tax=Sanguibacteroides justesenii TaxID=1547597 RepID=A0A0C3RDP6_9PORP|nr:MULTISPECIES: endopeptidase La [Sanguibacteroides]KIO42949.1 Lon protease [Sanguibacteroides justesenii]KIO46207.1 Lon protease [Sanguibacteroides justesenii]PXZ44270.1 endopeptidase La [Sanguibacteroides justesenii]
MNEINLDDILSENIQEEHQDLLQILGDEKELLNDSINIPDTLPILPLRNTVLFPGVIIPINIGREKSLKLIKYAYKQSAMIGVIAQKDTNTENPAQSDLYSIGTAASVLKILEMPDGTTTAIIQGKRRFQLEDILYDEPYHVGKIIVKTEEVLSKNDEEYNAISDSLKEMAMKIVKYSSNIPNEAGFALKNIESMLFLINFISSNTDIDYRNKQELLEIDSIKERAIKLLELLSKQVSILELKNDIQKKVKFDLDKQQREYFLHQQMKTIQNELGGNSVDDDIQELEEAAKKKDWGKNIQEFFEKELQKLRRQNPSMPDYSVQLNYLKELTELPWNHYSEDNFDLQKASEILDSDHYGLEKVKERILEYLAVLKLKGDMKSPIICLYGPPGVGKTSLGKSVARALNREFVRMSLGGLHDESEIRGHRRTYIGAMPGRIIQGIKKAGTSNPVFILDEIDKVGQDFRGDPQSALLEVLDPEQNSTFHDNYLDVDYDLSKVMFIATANDISTIAPPLRDRMEMIEVSGYLMEEKIEIAKRHLIPKQLTNHGVKAEEVEFSDTILNYIIDKYTRESGVRNLDKTLAKIMRQVAKHVALDPTFSIKLSKESVKEYLGTPIFTREEYQGNELPGVVTGLAWTAVGGEILYIESSISKGKGMLTMTGSLGEVMKESATLALEYIKSHAEELNIDTASIEEHNIHIHVPAGAVPKDGPSAGITMVTSLASSLTGRKVKKALAMTGEITLRGKVLPVGGIREKILAAKRAGIKEVILCHENKKDIDEIKKEYIKGIKFHFVDHIREVLQIALL